MDHECGPYCDHDVAGTKFDRVRLALEDVHDDLRVICKPFKLGDVEHTKDGVWLTVKIFVRDRHGS